MFSRSSRKKKSSTSLAANNAGASVSGGGGGLLLSVPAAPTDEFGGRKKERSGSLSSNKSQAMPRSHSARSLPLSPPSSLSASRNNRLGGAGGGGGGGVDAPPAPPPVWSFAPTSLHCEPPEGSSSSKPDKPEMHWGLMSAGTDAVLSLQDVAQLSETICEELSKRGLTTPLLFSSLALDVSAPKIRSLIQSYLRTYQNQHDSIWRQEVAFAGERELAWVLRWALSRILRVKGSELARGFVDWDIYDDWRGRERTASYPPTHFHAFTASLGPALQPLLVTLFTFFSRLAAHSHQNGCTPTVLASLFGPLLFGLPTSSLVSRTHASFVRGALATEHLLLAFVRSQQAAAVEKSSTAGIGIPGKLQDWIRGYPSMLPSASSQSRTSDYSSLEPRQGVRVIRAEGMKRDVRAYSKELFRSGEAWAGELERMGGGRERWEAWQRVLNKSDGGAGAGGGPRFSAEYRRRLHIPANLPPLASTAGARENLDPSRGNLSGRRSAAGGDVDSLGRLIPSVADDDHLLDEGGENYRSLTDKKWGDFLEGGFDGLESSSGGLLGLSGGGSRGGRSSIAKKLEFDLTEGAKKSHASKRETLSWNDFSSAGFTRTDKPLSDSLHFSSPVQKDILEWPEHREEVSRRLKKMQKDLPSFEYDTRPRIGGEVVLEEAFVDAWADLLISAGWMEREETTLRECNWAIVQYKASPRQPSPGNSFLPNDPRTEDAYFVFEEVVPVEYQARLQTTTPKKGLGLFASMRGGGSGSKRSGVDSRSDQVDSGFFPTRSRDRDEDFDSLVWRGGPTKSLSLSRHSPRQGHDSLLYEGGDAFQPKPTDPFVSASQTDHPPRVTPSKPTKLPKPVTNVHIGERKDKNASTSSSSAASSMGGLFRGLKAKKEAKRIQDPTPIEQHDVDFEVRTTSGDSDSPYLGGHARTASKDDMWIDIMVTSNSSRRRENGVVISNAATSSSSAARSRTASDPNASAPVASFEKPPPVPSLSQHVAPLRPYESPVGGLQIASNYSSPRPLGLVASEAQQTSTSTTPRPLPHMPMPPTILVRAPTIKAKRSNNPSGGDHHATSTDESDAPVTPEHEEDEHEAQLVYYAPEPVAAAVKAPFPSPIIGLPSCPQPLRPAGLPDLTDANSYSGDVAASAFLPSSATPEDDPALTHAGSHDDAQDADDFGEGGGGRHHEDYHIKKGDPDAMLEDPDKITETFEPVLRGISPGYSSYVHGQPLHNLPEEEEEEEDYRSSLEERRRY